MDRNRSLKTQRSADPEFRIGASIFVLVFLFVCRGAILACERDGDPIDMICRMKGVKAPKVEQNTLHKIIKEYLQIHSPVTPSPEKNAVAMDASPILLTQVTGVDYTFY